MLESALIESGGRAQTRKPATVLVSTGLHVSAIIVLMIAPLTPPTILPVLSTVGLPLPVFGKSDAPKAKPGTLAPAVEPHILPTSGEFIAPVSIPPDIALFDADPAGAFRPVTTASTGNIGSILSGLAIGRDIIADPPPPPPPPPTAPAMAPIRVGGNVQQANLIQQVLPKYPDLARQARVQGVVILEATIAKDGSVGDLRVISGHPLLLRAALNAVKQWKYKPTILNGDPIEVITTVTVTFLFE